MSMTKKQFDDRLKALDLTRQLFAELTKLAYGTVNNWQDEGSDKGKPIPSWVTSWLDNYAKAKSMDSVVEAVKPYIGNL